MNLVIPWSRLLALIAPHAPAGKTERPPFAKEVLLCIPLLPQLFGSFGFPSKWFFARHRVEYEQGHSGLKV